jgi:hypothetical protein
MAFRLAELFVELSTRGSERVNEAIEVIKGTGNATGYAIGALFHAMGGKLDGKELADSLLGHGNARSIISDGLNGVRTAAVNASSGLASLKDLNDKAFGGSKFAQFIMNLSKLANISNPLEKITFAEAAKQKTLVNAAFMDPDKQRDAVVWVGGRHAAQQNAAEARREKQNNPTPENERGGNRFEFSAFDQFAKSIQQGLSGNDAGKKTADNTAKIKQQLDVGGPLVNSIKENTKAIDKLNLGFA